MSDLNFLRSEINNLHSQIIALILKRLALAKEIAKLKSAQKIELEDLSREKEIIHQFDSQIVNDSEKLAVQNILRCILNESKVVMRESINEKK
jgi:chorismate mutase